MTFPTLYTWQQASKATGVPVGSLRAAVKSGDLRLTRIGGTVRIREDDLREMLDKCRDHPSPRASGSDEQAARPDGSSSTDQNNTALDAALATAKALKRPSRSTSPANTSPTGARLS